MAEIKVPIIEYKIFEEAESRLPALEEEVNAQIQKGWQPYGPLVVSGVGVLQVMVKFEEELF